MAAPLKLFSATLAAAVLVATGAGAAETAPPGKACFLTRDWQGWSAPGNGDALYLRVRMNDIYRVDLTPGTHVRKSGDRFLVLDVRGSGWICSAVDLDMKLSDTRGFREPLIARSLRKLTPQEVAAIPKKDMPY